MLHWYSDTTATRAVFVESLLLEENASLQPLKQKALPGRLKQLPDFLPKRKYDLKPICLRMPLFGRTNNRVITIAKMTIMNLKEDKGRALALDREWTLRPQYSRYGPEALARGKTNGT